MNIRNILVLGTSLLALWACNAPTIPDSYAQADDLPAIYPDYVDVTIPVNIAPLTFQFAGKSAFDDAVVRFSQGDAEIICQGMKIRPATDLWHTLAAKASGGDISVEVFTRSGDRWTRHQPFAIHVSPDSIDPYLSYRLISPSYVTYEELTLCQRCLENYDEEVMVDNMLCSTEQDGQCVNCHSYQQYNPRRMQFHARQNHGGTVIAYDGNIRKVNLKNDSTISAGVYPSWHPTLPLIAYSTNLTSQSFHTRSANKIEVADEASDVILYDIEKNEVTNVDNRPDEFEVYPYWAPDGRTLYYCSAHFEFRDTVKHSNELFLRADEVKYNILRRTFNPQTRTFGPRDTVFLADTLGRSATQPRPSPDGRFLMFSMGNYGCFHIWHHEADLYIIDLDSGTTRCMDEINSPDTESYHSWSSNGRWVVFSSRRTDGNYTRPFFAHIDSMGRGTKPFELPQADPDLHNQLYKSYNIPEFMRGRVAITPQQFADVLKNTEAQPATFRPQQ